MSNEDKSIGCLIMCCLAAFVVLIVLSFTGCMPNYSTGERSGIVWKLSEKGMFWVSGEGELNMGGVEVGSKGTVNPVVWKFSCVNPAVKKKLMDAQRSGVRVTIKYRQWAMGPRYLDTAYEAEDVIVENHEQR